MREIIQNIVKQNPGEPIRRWFLGDYFDLVVWVEEGQIVGFQLCYDINYNQRALTWFENKGFLHNKVDDGENKGGRLKSTPILIADGIFDYLTISKRFQNESTEIDPKVANFVIEKIRNYR